jgi:3-dehydroquinate synthase
LEEFREHLGGELTITLLEDIGRGIEVHSMNQPLIVESIYDLQQIHQTTTTKVLFARG